MSATRRTCRIPFSADVLRRVAARHRLRQGSQRQAAPLRLSHGITRGGTIYFFDPSGNRNEVFAGGYRTGPDFRPITWTMDQAARGINYTHREIDQNFLQVVT